MNEEKEIIAQTYRDYVQAFRHWKPKPSSLISRLPSYLYPLGMFGLWPQLLR